MGPSGLRSPFARHGRLERRNAPSSRDFSSGRHARSVAGASCLRPWTRLSRSSSHARAHCTRWRPSGGRRALKQESRLKASARSQATTEGGLSPAAAPIQGSIDVAGRGADAAGICPQVPCVAPPRACAHLLGHPRVPPGGSRARRGDGRVPGLVSTGPGARGDAGAPGADSGSAGAHRRPRAWQPGEPGTAAGHRMVLPAARRLRCDGPRSKAHGPRPNPGGGHGGTRGLAVQGVYTSAPSSLV